MKSKKAQSPNKNATYCSIRVKEKTKDNVTRLLKKINKNEDCGKVTFDHFVGHFIDNINDEDIQALQLKTITWSHEEKRLRKLWEKQKGKISDDKWKEMLFLCQLREFVIDHSRISAHAQ